MLKRATRRFGRRALVALLILSLSAMMVPAVAFGIDPEKTVDASTENKSENLGDVNTTKDTGLVVKTSEGHEATVEVGGVTVTHPNTDFGGVFATTNPTSGKSGGDIDVTTGNVTSDGYGVYADVYGSGSVDIETKDINAKKIGATLEVENDGGRASLVVEGDVVAKEDVGVRVLNTPSNGVTDVLVTGTIKSEGAEAKGYAVDISDKGHNTVTAWKLEAASGNLVSNETVAKSINYIIKVNGEAMTASSSGKLTAAGANGKTSHDYNVANEGEKVYLNVANGYKITSATQGGIELSQEDGKYFYVVTRGGGINIQATAEAIKQLYTVIFQDEDGTELQKTEYEEGATPEYKGTTPTKAADDSYTYAFEGWMPTIGKVAKDITYTAAYAKTAKEKPTSSSTSTSTSTSNPGEPASTSDSGKSTPTSASDSGKTSPSSSSSKSSEASVVKKASATVETGTTASAAVSSGPSTPQTADPAQELPALAALLLAAAAFVAARRMLAPARTGKHAR